MRIAIALALGIAIGAGMMWLVAGDGRVATRGSGSTGALATSSDDPREVARLAAELDRAREERAGLLAQVEALEALLAERAMLAEDGAEGAVSAGPSGDGSRAAGDREEDWFDREALVGAGYAPNEIDWIREMWERAVMARLELEDARLRKGESGSGAAVRDVLALEQMLRNEFGDEGYDAVRFAMNEENRVILTDLIEGSAGFQAGLRPGDEVISYDGARVFRPRDLKLSIAEGVRDRPVEMRVLRDGEEVRVFLPRGPIGARLAYEVRPPVR